MEKWVEEALKSQCECLYENGEFQICLSGARFNLVILTDVKKENVFNLFFVPHLHSFYESQSEFILIGTDNAHHINKLSHRVIVYSLAKKKWVEMIKQSK